MTADIVGPVCESGDFFAREREMAEPAEGDLLAVMSAGAYGFVMSSNYNSRPRAPEILVDGADVHVIRDRDTFRGSDPRRAYRRSQAGVRAQDAMATLEFTKMHGCGNDYIYVVAMRARPADPSALSVKLSDRHFGVGGDGLIMLAPSRKADIRMEMYNADGSRGDMCGNGIRCLARLAFERGLVRANPMVVETDAG